MDVTRDSGATPAPDAHVEESANVAAETPASPTLASVDVVPTTPPPLKVQPSSTTVLLQSLVAEPQSMLTPTVAPLKSSVAPFQPLLVCAVLASVKVTPESVLIPLLL
jgi:hypothetical protein